MKKRIILIALSLMTLSAQAQDYHFDVNNDGMINMSDVTLLINKILGKEPATPVRPLTISVTQEPFIDPDASTSSMMKSPITTTETLATNPGEFYVDYTYWDVNQGKNVLGDPEFKTNWVAEDGHWHVGSADDSGFGGWPANADLYDGKVTFYAYANYVRGYFGCLGYVEDDYGNDDVSQPYVTFIADQNSSEQKDFLVAKTQDTYYHNNNSEDPNAGHITFHFDHACTAVQFFIKKSAKLIESGVTVSVTDVELHNVYDKGDYFFNNAAGQQWTNLCFSEESSKTTYTLADNDETSPVVVTDDYTANQLSTETDKADKYFFMIPQTVTPWNPNDSEDKYATSSSGAYIKLTGCEIIEPNGGKSYKGDAYIPFSVTWEKGKKQKAVISVGTSLRKLDGTRIFNTGTGLLN